MSGGGGEVPHALDPLTELPWGRDLNTSRKQLDESKWNISDRIAITAFAIAMPSENRALHSLMNTNEPEYG